MPINRKKNRGPGTPGYIPARSSQNGGQRACLCPDENTYSRECCTGDIKPARNLEKCNSRWNE